MEEKGAKFRDYFSWEEPVKTAPSHRVLAMRRGENEEVLSLSIAPPEEDALALLKEPVHQSPRRRGRPDRAGRRRRLQAAPLPLHGDRNPPRLQGGRRISRPSGCSPENLRELLLSSPLGPKRVMGVDPGFRTGCKNRLPRPAGQAAPPRHHLPSPARSSGGRYPEALP